MLCRRIHVKNIIVNKCIANSSSFIQSLSKYLHGMVWDGLLDLLIQSMVLQCTWQRWCISAEKLFLTQ